MNPRQAREIAIRVLDELEELLVGKGMMIPSKYDNWSFVAERSIICKVLSHLIVVLIATSSSE